MAWNCHAPRNQRLESCGVEGSGLPVLRKEIRKAVITVPAYFDDAQRQATRDAGRSPAWKWSAWSTSRRAAALAYGLGVREQQDPATAAQGNGSPAKPAASPGGITGSGRGPVASSSGHRAAPRRGIAGRGVRPGRRDVRHLGPAAVRGCVSRCSARTATRNWAATISTARS